MFFAPTVVAAKLRKLVHLIEISLFSSLFSPLKVGSAGLLCQEVKQYPVLYDKQMKGYKQKDKSRELFRKKTPYQMFEWVLNRPLIPSTSPDYFCQRII